jgi:GNAT superfamily N-acetyltransferase
MNRTQSGRFGPDGPVDGVGGVDRDGRFDRPAGRAPVIRPACPADVPSLDDFFAGLSTRTRYLRFFAPVTPGSALLHLLSGDAGNADAVVAVHGAAVIGHAMAVDQAAPGAPMDARPRTTDVGVVVADAWQGQGLGSALMRALITRARARGVTSAAMDVLPGNRRVLGMIVSHWPSARIEYFPDCTTICASLLLEAPRYLHAEAGHDDLAAARHRGPVSVSGVRPGVRRPAS